MGDRLPVESLTGIVWNTQLAEAVLETGDANEPLDLLRQAIDVLRHSEETWWESAIFRLTGEVLLTQNSDAEKQAETHFSQAINIAQTQGAKSLELRASTSR